MSYEILKRDATERDYNVGLRLGVFLPQQAGHALFVSSARKSAEVEGVVVYFRFLQRGLNKPISDSRRCAHGPQALCLPKR
jgi:hypothetical protein